jgi:hypothetical protein
MEGTWVTSFSGVVHDDPVDSNPVPRIAAYESPGHSTSGGYFFASTLLTLKCDGAGNFTGKVQIIRGGSPAPQNVVRGKYKLDLNANLGVIEGTIFAGYPTSNPNVDIQSTYAFVAKNRDELEWLRTSSDLEGHPFRLQQSQGTLRRVTVHP